MATSSVVIGVAILVWLRRSGEIIDEVDALTFTPSDFTLEIWNIPDGADVNTIQNLCMTILDESANG